MLRVCRIALLCAGIVSVMAYVRVGESDETDAIRGIQQLNMVEAKYANRFGAYGTLDDLRTRAPDLATIVNALIGDASVGYKYRVSRTVNGYTIVAQPVRPDHRSFYSDETLVLRDGRGTGMPRFSLGLRP